MFGIVCVQPLFPVKRHYIEKDLSVIRVVIEGKEKIKSWLMYCWIYLEWGAYKIIYFC